MIARTISKAIMNGTTALEMVSRLMPETFWFDGFGPVILLCLAVVAVWSVWVFFADREALEQRRKAMDAEVRAAAQRLMDERRPQLEAMIRSACEKRLADRERALADEEYQFSKRHWEQDWERQTLNDEKADLQEEKGKITAWKNELAALRQKAEADKERRQALKQRIGWARDALAAEPANVGLALRHLKMAEKM